MPSKFYITTAIDYPSGPPHIGHAYEKVLCDVIARWRSLEGDDVFFLTGTDEHGQKIERYAREAGESPKHFVDRMSLTFKKLCEKLNISNNDFIRTTDERHKRVCQDIFTRIYENGDIYKGKYEGPYCVECEAFYVERDLLDGNCPVHEKAVSKLDEEGYFFRMSKYQDFLLKFLNEREDFILPEARRNEILNRVKGGIKDLYVSRSNFSWGVPVPEDSKHVIYVWVDALINYISALKFPGDEFKKYWPCDVHMIGKDILWQHAVIWPSILSSAGLELPKRIFVHGFVNVGGEKLSKSKGMKIDPLELIERFGADPLRYFLIREISHGEDGNFSEEALVKRHDNDLANDLGNLLARSLTMIEKYFHGKIPKKGVLDSVDRDLESFSQDTILSVRESMSNLRTGEALSSIWKLISRSNKYIEETSPWILAKDERGRAHLETVLYQLVDAMRLIGVLLFPFMPDTSGKIFEQIGMERKISLKDELSFGKLKAGQAVKKGEYLFKKKGLAL